MASRHPTAFTVGRLPLFGRRPALHSCGPCGLEGRRPGGLRHTDGKKDGRPGALESPRMGPEGWPSRQGPVASSRKVFCLPKTLFTIENGLSWGALLVYKANTGGGCNGESLVIQNRTIRLFVSTTTKRQKDRL